jgi:SnoaL-like domain
MSDEPGAVHAWHRVFESKDAGLLDDLLADDVVFRSPAVFAPQVGKAITTVYLTAALDVLGATLRYTHQWHDESSAVLEFEADLDGVVVHGIDMLRWNDADKLTSFTVMLRPMRGLEQLILRMRQRLAAGQS